MKKKSQKIAVLSGGVGGTKLVDGLYRALSAEDLSVIVNTGDDFEHWGLWISPDLDTIMYTLGGVAHPTQGWGIANDTFQVLSAMKTRGQDAWFKIGDYDLATDLIRTDLLNQNKNLTEITRQLCEQYAIKCSILPMCNGPRPTHVECEDGRMLPFQRWLVEEGAARPAKKLIYGGTDSASPEVMAALTAADVILIAPSNPYTSIDPILAVPSIRELLLSKRVVAVSPLIQGQAVKGPLASMIRSIDHIEPSTTAIAKHYAPFLKGLLVNHGDTASAPVAQRESNIMMQDIDDRIRLAYEVLEFAESI